MRRGVLLGLLATLACRATTGRPTFVVFPEAETAEMGFGLVSVAGTVARLTDTVVDYLRRDSIPIPTVKRFDGFFDSGWIDAKTLKATGRRPLGDGVVRVRGFVDPGKPGYGRVDVETVYRPFDDPSRPARELEVPVAATHPVNAKVAAVLEKLKAVYGVPEDSTAKKTDKGDGRPGAGKPAAARPDTAKKGAAVPPASTDTAKKSGAPAPAKPDAAKKPAKPDTTAKRDTTAVRA